MILFIQEYANTVGSVSEGAEGLTLAGWIFIAIAWTAVISLLIFCYRKILQKSVENKQQVKFQSTSGINEAIN